MSVSEPPQKHKESRLTIEDVNFLLGDAVSRRMLGLEDIPEALADLAARMAESIGEDGGRVRATWEAFKVDRRRRSVVVAEEP